MIEMKVMGIAIDTRTGSPIVVLNDLEGRRALPIWIGSSEASSIIRQIENIEVTRPMTHDLIINIIEDTGYTLDSIEIHDVSENTYFANLLLTNAEEEELIIDARPSDAIALALRVDAPIYVSPNVMDSATISTDKVRDEKESEDFHNFIESINASDFKKLIDDDDSNKQ